MARYRKIDPRIWNDAKFRDLSDKAKLVFLMLLTHPHMTAIGAMRSSADGLASELGWQSKAFREAFQEVLAKGLAKHDERASFVWLPNFLKYNGPESPNVVKAWANAVDLLPECEMKAESLQAVKAFAEGLPEAFLKVLPEAFAKGMPYQEQEQEQEQEKEKDSPPSAAESELHKQIVAAYHAICPDLAAVKVWNQRRKGKLRARIIERKSGGKAADTVGYWEAYFRKVAGTPFLCGVNDNGWRADFEWLIEAENFAKVIEGRYDNTKGITHGRSYASAGPAALS